MCFSYRLHCGRLLAYLLLVFPLANLTSAQTPPPSPNSQNSLSQAQIVLFDTPHLSNVSHPETLRYDYRRLGPGSFQDTVSVHITKVNSDGSKDLTFDFLTGDRRVSFPEMDQFHGNPLFMLMLERDVAMMHEALGVSAGFLRNVVRRGFLDAAVTNGNWTLPDGTTVPARIVTMQPFAGNERFQRLVSLQQKTYRFVLAKQVPGMIAEVDIATPADPNLNAPALEDKATFTGVTS